MITTIFVAIFLLILYLDYRAYRRWIVGWHKSLRRATVSLLCLFDFFPLIVMIVFKYFSFNEEGQLHFWSWVFTIFIIATLVRLLFYCFAFAIKRPPYAGVLVGTLSGLMLLALFLYSVLVTRTDIVVEQVDIHSREIPAAFDGYRIAHFSDLHIGSLLDAESEIDNLVDIINNQNCDLVAFSGDLIHIKHDELSEKIMQQLASIKSRDGVVAVMGNHDTGVYVKDTVTLPRRENSQRLAAKISAMGWHLLNDSTIYIRRATDSIAVTGIGFSDALLEYKHSFVTPDNFSSDELYRTLPDSIFNVTISHLPQLWDNLKVQKQADLTLAGHVHAMQMKFNIGGVALSPAMLMYGEWSGLYGDENEGHLYVNDGIGSVGYNMRIGANPAVSVLVLRSDPK